MAKNWIQGAIKKPGSFTEYAKREGLSMGEAIQKGKTSKNSTTRKRAVLAATLRKMSKNKTSNAMPAKDTNPKMSLKDMMMKYSG